MYHQENLPVPADRVMTEKSVGQMRGYPMTPVSQQLPQNEASTLNATLINAVQQSAHKSPIRTFMFNMLSDNQYNNQVYSDLFSATITYYIALRQMGTDPNTAVGKAVDETILAEMPIVVDRYPDLQNYISDQQSQDLYNLNAMRNQIDGLITQSQQQPPMQQQGQPYSQQMQQGPMNMQPQQPQMQQQRRGPTMYGAGGYNQPQMQQPPQMQQGYGHPMNQPQMHQPQQQQPMNMGRPGAYRGGPPRPSATPTRSASNMLDNQQNNAGQGSPVTSRKPAVGATPVKTSAVFEGDEMKWTDPVDREIGHLVSIGTAKEATHQSDPKYAPAIDRHVELSVTGHKPARRSNQKIVENKTADNKVTYQIVEDDKMNYEDHEQDLDLVKISRKGQVGPKVGVPSDWGKLRMPVVLEEDDKEIELEIDEPVALDELVDGHTLQQVRVEALRKSHDKGVGDYSERVFECYGNLKTPILSNKDEYRTLVDAMEPITTLTGLVDMLVNIKDDISPTLWYTIHDRMTAIFNRRLGAGMGLPWSVDSISTDYSEAMEALAEEFQQVAMDRFKVNTYVSMRKAMMVIFSDRTNILHLVDDVSITTLPWSSDDIDLVLESKYSMLTKSVSEHFHQAALELFDRTNSKDKSVGRRYLVTSDNVWIELQSSDLSNKTLIIGKVNVE